MNCPKCDHPNPEGAIECVACGVILKKARLATQERPLRAAGASEVPREPEASSATSESLNGPSNLLGTLKQRVIPFDQEGNIYPLRILVYVLLIVAIGVVRWSTGDGEVAAAGGVGQESIGGLPPPPIDPPPRPLAAKLILESEEWQEPKYAFFPWFFEPHPGLQPAAPLPQLECRYPIVKLLREESLLQIKDALDEFPDGNAIATELTPRGKQRLSKVLVQRSDIHGEFLPIGKKELVKVTVFTAAGTRRVVPDAVAAWFHWRWSGEGFGTSLDLTAESGLNLPMKGVANLVRRDGDWVVDSVVFDDRSRAFENIYPHACVNAPFVASN